MTLEHIVDPVRVQFAARTIAFCVSRGSARAGWLLPLGYELGSGAFPTDNLLLLQERWLVKACANKWPLKKFADFHMYTIIDLLRRHTAAEQFLICEVLEKRYNYYG